MRSCASKLNAAALVALAFAVAALADLPTIRHSRRRKRFTTQGALWSTYGGPAAAVVLVIFPPVLSGAPETLYPGADFHWFPLTDPGIVATPLGFLLGWLGAELSKETPDDEKYRGLEVRPLTPRSAGGAGRLPAPRRSGDPQGNRPRSSKRSRTVECQSPPVGFQDRGGQTARDPKASGRCHRAHRHVRPYRHRPAGLAHRPLQSAMHVLHA